MDTKKPLVSIILPVYNAAKYLPSTLQHLLSQTYSNIEIIAIDDHSTDTTFEELTKISQKDKRLQIFRNVKHYGMRLTLNRAIKRAQGKFIAFTKAGDINHKSRLEKQINYLHSNQHVVAVGTQCTFIDEKSKQIQKSEFPQDSSAIYKKPLQGVSMLFETFMVNKYRIPKDILEFHSNKQPFIYSDLCVKLLQYGHVVNLKEYLYSYRRIANQQASETKEIIASIKVWFRAFALFDHKVQIKSFLPAFIKPQISK